MHGRDIIGKKEASELLLNKLRDVQKKEGYISEDGMKKISNETKIPMTRIYEVATFYSFFHVQKQGRHIIRICDSPSCNMHGSENMMKILEKLLGIKPGEMTKDGRFSLEITSCIGCCDKSPSALIDGVAYTELNENKIKGIIRKCK